MMISIPGGEERSYEVERLAGAEEEWHSLRSYQGACPRNDFKILGWPKSSFIPLKKGVWENPNELFGQPNN